MADDLDRLLARDCGRLFYVVTPLDDLDEHDCPAAPFCTTVSCAGCHGLCHADLATINAVVVHRGAPPIYACLRCVPDEVLEAM